MPTVPFTLRQLEVFASLCATRSFRRTAEDLGISQASVSNQVKTLEGQLGLVLLARYPGKRPTLTPEGMAFLHDLRTFQHAAEALAAHRRGNPALEEPARYRIRIGQGLVDRFIRPKLDGFLAVNPLIELEFDAQFPADRGGRDIVAGRYDFALFHLRADLPLEPSLSELALLRSGLYGHPKFASGKTLPLPAEEISGLPFILPRAGSRGERELLEGFERHHIRPRHVVGHTQYFDVMETMVERGLGIASFPEAILSPSMRDELVMLFPLENWRLVWHRRDHGSDQRCNAVATFLQASVLGDPNYPTIEVFAPGYAS